MKKILIFFSIIFSFFYFIYYYFGSNLSQNEYKAEDRIYKLFAKNSDNVIKSESTTYQIYEKIFITSLHSVIDDTLNYFINNKKVKIVQKNEKSDIAYISDDLNFSLQNFKEFDFEDVKIGDEVYIFSFVDGKIQKKFGKVISKNTNIIGYFDNGKKYNFVAKILTDIDVKEGDSGSVIFDKNNKIVGIIHIVNKK